MTIVDTFTLDPPPKAPQRAEPSPDELAKARAIVAKVKQTNKAYNPDQPRDPDGRWGSGGGGDGTTPSVAEHIVDATVAQGGGTFDPHTGESPTTGFQVARSGADTVQIPASTLADHEATKQAVLSYLNGHDLKGAYLGTWVDSGTLWMEPSENVASRADAVSLGAARDQIAIWDNAAGEEVATGGTGAVQKGVLQDPGRLGSDDRRGKGSVRGSPRDEDAGRPRAGSVAAELAKYSDSQPRDDHGRFASGGGDSGSSTPTTAPRVPGPNFGGPPPAGPTFAMGTTRPLVTAVDSHNSPILNAYAVETRDGQQIHGYINPDVPPEEKPSAQQMQTALSAVADMHDRYGAELEKDDYPHSAPPPPDLRVISSRQTYNETGSEGVVAYVATENPTEIKLNGTEPWTATDEDHMTGESDLHGVRPDQYATTHEYGHWQDAYRAKGVTPNERGIWDSLMWQKGGAGLTDYGHSNPKEAYAENFAVWNLTNGGGATLASGADASAVARTAGMYAQAYGWHK